MDDRLHKAYNELYDAIGEATDRAIGSSDKQVRRALAARLQHMETNVITKVVASLGRLNAKVRNLQKGLASGDPNDPSGEFDRG